MVTIGVEIDIEDNDISEGLTKGDEGLSSTSLFGVNQLASLRCFDYEKKTVDNTFVWSNSSKNLVVSVGDNISGFKIGEKVTKVFSNKLPVDYLKAVSNLPSSHIIVGVTFDNKIIFYDGVKESFAELSLMVPVLTNPIIYCHRWKDQTYIIICGKGSEKTVWITLSEHVSFYEKADDLTEAINEGSRSGISDHSLSDSVVVFSPENNLLYAFTRTPEGFNRYYRMTNEGIFVHREAYSVKGYLSVTMTPFFAFALSTDGFLDIFELKMLVLCKQILLVSENTKECEIICDMQVTATSKTCSLEGLYMLVSVLVGKKHQLQIRSVQTNEIVCSIDCSDNSSFLRWDPILNLMAFVEMSGGQLTLKTITEATPDLKIEKLVSMKKFKEALDLAKKFAVSFDPIYKAQASDLLEKLRSGGYENEDIDILYNILKKIKNQDAFCDLCLEGIISLNMFDVVKKLLDLALDTKTKNRYIVEQFNTISEQFTTARMIFSFEEFTEKWLSIVAQRTPMYSLMADAVQDGNYKRADIIWNRYILKSEFNKNITKECTTRMIQIFSYHALDKNIRSDLLKFMENNFIPYALMKLGGEIGCMYAETLIQVIVDLEDEEDENYPLVAYNISLSLERISKLLKERVLTPGEKCLFVNIRTDMGYDSFCQSDILGRLNKLKENLLKLVNLKERYNLTFEYEKFVGLSEEDIGVHIVEKMLIKEDESEHIYTEIFKPYCDEFVLDFKSLICDFVQKWSAQQIAFTGDIQGGLSKNKIGSICKLIGRIDDPVLQIKALQHLADAVPFNWPKELTQSVYTILTDNTIAKDIKSDLTDRCKLAEICHIIKIYKDVPYEIEEIIKYRNEFEYLIQSISLNGSSVNTETLANDVFKLYKLRHSYCKLPGTFVANYNYIYVQLWIPYLTQWRFSGFEKKEPMQWLFNLPNNEAQISVAKYSVDYILDIYKRGRQNLKSPDEIIYYLKTLSIVKSFILNYLSKIEKYRLTLDKLLAIESLYSRFKILKSPTFFLETPKESSNFISEMVSTYGIENWENMLEIINITKMDSILAYNYLLNACVESGKINQAASILFTISLKKYLLNPKMISMIRIVLDNIFLRLHEASNERSFNLTNFVNMIMLALKVFIAQGDGMDTFNFNDILAFSKYHKFLSIVKDMVDSTDVLQNDTVEVMDTSEITVKDIINWDIHPLAHLQKTNKLKYYITLNPRSKPFTKNYLQLPMNGEYNIESLLSLAASLLTVVKDDNDYVEENEMKIKNYIDGWKNNFNQLLMDGQFFDVFNLLEIYNTLPISKKGDIRVSEIVKHSAVGLLEKILLLPDCDLELGLGVINSVSEKHVHSILQEIRNCLKTNANPRVHINLCELVASVYHKLSQIGLIEMLTKRYDECLWKRKLSKFGFNYSSKMTLNEVISSLVRCNVPHDIAHEYCIYNNIDLNSFRLQCALHSSLYSSELLDMNDNLRYIEQLKRTSALLSIVIITEEHVPFIQDAIMKMSPYNHEGLLLLIDKALQFIKDEGIPDNFKHLLYDWKIVIDFVMSYGKRNAEILPNECNWLSLHKSSIGNGTSSATSFVSVESNQSVGEISMIEFEVMEEKREAARKRMPQCAIQRLPFHLLCSTNEDEVKQYVCPIVFNEVNIHNAYRWVGIIVNTESVLRLSQSECIFTAINKRIKYAEENNIFVGDVDRDWIMSAIDAVDVSKEITSTVAELLEGDKKEEILKYEKELSKRIIKYSVEKILSDDGLLDQETKAHLNSSNISEMIRFIYSNLIDWNNYQDRTSKMKACKLIADITDLNLSSLHSTIIDSLLIQETMIQVGDPDATLNMSEEVVPINQGIDNRLECDILDDDANVSKIVNILRTEDYSNMIKKMFSILNKDPKVLPGGITTLIKVILCICRMYPRNGEKNDSFKAKKPQILVVLKGAYYYHMLSNINVNCKMVDLMSEVHSTEKDFVVVNIIRDYLKKSPEYSVYMKTYIPRMIMGRQFSMAKSILNDSNGPITSDHMGSNILQFVLKTIEGILKQNFSNTDIAEDMLRFIIKYSISFGYSRPPRETGLFHGNHEMSKIVQCILNPTGV
ncbi:Hypothetical protein SRAE_2000500400 [Strongyloides ratti]|uniref:RZZ complex subunit KNTC1/ROD C-terminal domain-containing protein n=1 Tax=Strongyloides ratti TaxID=34506 RepID=A0A090LQB0_STRRB|nr:Hypothetical protein SRAE_2000500400 [Strongyloides ratti]CEF70371.1 Hypothetical protein SRAE_2000500400 [Strongyloides ratti]